MRCNSRIRMLICYQALLAQSLVCQGFSTIFGNLFTTRDLQPGVTEPWLVEYSMYLQNTQRIANFSTACGSVAAINRFQVPTSLHGEPLSRIILVRYSSFCVLESVLIVFSTFTRQCPLLLLVLRSFQVTGSTPALIYIRPLIRVSIVVLMSRFWLTC